MGHCFSEVVEVSKKMKKKNRHGIGKKVAVLDWEWGWISAPKEGQKMPVHGAKTWPRLSFIFPLNKWDADFMHYWVCS